MSRTREGRTWRRLSGLVGAKCNNTCFSLGVSFGGAGLPAAMHRHAAMYEGRGAIVHRSGRSGRRSCRWRGCAASRRPSCSHGASGFSGAGARSESVRAPRIQLSVASHRRHLELEAGAIDRRAATNGMPPDGRNQCRALPNQSCLQRPPPPPRQQWRKEVAVALQACDGRTVTHPVFPTLRASGSPRASGFRDCSPIVSCDGRCREGGLGRGIVAAHTAFARGAVRGRLPASGGAPRGAATGPASAYCHRGISWHSRCRDLLGELLPAGRGGVVMPPEAGFLNPAWLCSIHGQTVVRVSLQRWRLSMSCLLDQG